MTGRSRSEARGRPKHERAEDNSGPRWTLIAIVAVVLLVLCGTATALSFYKYDKRPEIGAIAISIEGRDAVLSAKYSLSPGVRVRDSDLDLVSGDAEFPVEMTGGKASVEMGVTDVADILGRGTASIVGSVKASLRFPPITVDQDVNRRIDIESYLSLNSTLRPDNITVEWVGLGEIRVGLDFEADLRSDISLEARNTTARIITAFGSYSGKIDRLVLNNDGSGDASVRIPTISIAPLFLGKNLIIVDFWGFEFSFDFPVNG